MKITLIGDSIFDNKVYLAPDEPDTIEHLRMVMKGDECELLANDGSITAGVSSLQVRQIDSATDWIVVSSGGNDALSFSHVLDANANTVLLDLHAAGTIFREDYERLMDQLAGFSAKLAVCTIYSGNFDSRKHQKKADAAISVFNDIIYRAARTRGIPVIELRDFFVSPEDYANPI